MVNWVLRGAVLLWALLFLIIGIGGFLDPAAYEARFGIGIEGVAANTVRADLSAFFLVAAGSAAVGALVPGWTRALLVPAALYGTALLGRLFGVASGDAINDEIVMAMIIEALSLALMLGSWWMLSRPAAGTDPATGATDSFN